ncbi:DUF6789 family protein [Natronomonas sp. EA1]|uniref:DUF6789 family protein n=1 Tax=Natronomonas sp. EA1 TaxID=3421655 RepID=UPI003EB71C9D
MADTDARTENVGVDVEFEENGEPDFDTLLGVITDGFVGAIGGFVGTSVMTVVLLVATTIGVFDFVAFEELATLSGLAAFAPMDARSFGYLIFLLGGMVTWPLLLASLGSYLPGDRFALKGIPFGFVLWTGFALAFYTGQTGLALAGYLVLTLIGHFAYGFALGTVFDYLSTRPKTLV